MRQLPDRAGVAARAAIAMAIILVVGEVSGHPLAGVTASTGALSGGFASLQGTCRSRAGWAVAATGALALSAFVGGTIGHLEGPTSPPPPSGDWARDPGGVGTGTLAVGLRRHATPDVGAGLDRPALAAVDEVAHSAEALAGQLRAVVRLAAVPARGDSSRVLDEWSVGLVAVGRRPCRGLMPARLMEALGEAGWFLGA